MGTGAWVVVGMTAVVVAGLAGTWWWRRPAWMGIGDKTLWDWLSLGLVPIGITIGTIALSSVQQEIERNRSEEAMVQDYVDRISALVLSEARDQPEAVAVGRAQTTTILQVLDGPRAGRVLAFLDEMDLLTPYAPDLDGVRLAGAELKGVTLDGQGLEATDLTGADLEDSSLVGVDLESTDLSGADLDGAVLRGATFTDTVVADATLAGTDLRGADLRGALGLANDQVSRACLDATTALPTGLDVIPDCRDDAHDDDGDDEDGEDGDGD